MRTQSIRLLYSLLAHLLLIAAALAAQQQCGGLRRLDHPALQGPNATCREYRRVCFDQGSVISYNEAHSPRNRNSVRIPQLNITHLAYNWGGDGEGGNTDRLRYALSFYPPLAFRAGAGALEASPDLREPRFEACAAPLVMWTMWPHNFAEVFSHVVARVWALQSEGVLGPAPTLVIGTPVGERLPGFFPTLLRAFTPHPVVSLGEFSQRCTSSGDASPAGGPTSGPGRCFERAVLCAFSYGHYAADYGAAQAVLQHFQAQLPQPAARFDSGDGVLKVLIERREGPSRNLLNAAELERLCNRAASWQGRLAGGIKRVQCRSLAFSGDTLENMAAVRGADVLVAVHGGACTNWLFMREGSSLLEIRPFEFGSVARSWPDSHFSAISEAVDFKVRWYGVNIEDPDLSSPSQLEAEHPVPPTQAKSSSYAKQARDRHVRLPFDALQEMLARVAAARGSRQLYLEQRGQRQHYAELLPGGELRPVTGTVESRSGGSGQPGDDTEDIAATLARGWVHLAVACFAAAVLFAGRRYGRAAVQWPQPPHSS